MELLWTATAPGVLGVERRTSKESYVRVLMELMDEGEGYTEAHFADADYPTLTMGFRGGHAVVHQFADEGTVLLLHAENRSYDAVLVSMPSIEEDVDFESGFVFPLDEAWNIFKRFLDYGSAKELGAWILL